MSRRFRVLFLCTGNSARSQIAEAVLEHDGAGRFEAHSAGTEPAGEVNQGALAVLAANGVPWAGHPPRRVDMLEHEHWDLVVTVCDDARESCPVFPAAALVHWGMPDPAAVAEPAARHEAFQSTFDALRQRIGTLIQVPVERLTSARVETLLREPWNHLPNEGR